MNQKPQGKNENHFLGTGLGPNQGTSNMCPTAFQNCCETVTAMYHCLLFHRSSRVCCSYPMPVSWVHVRAGWVGGQNIIYFIGVRSKENALKELFQRRLLCT